jgi:hypothetical protein
MSLTRKLALLLVIAGLLASAPARAGDDQQCKDAAREGQELRDGGRLREARDRFVLCARDVCPSFVVKFCVPWLTEIEARIPTLVVHARDKVGRDVVAVRVSVDGRVVADRLEGTPIRVDPGAHRLRFEVAAGEVVEEQVLVVEGAHDRKVDVSFTSRLDAAGRSLPEPATPIPSRPVPAGVWVLGAIGAGGLIAFGVLEGVGWSAYTKLRDGCAKTASCDRADVDRARFEFVGAAVSLGVGGAALIGAGTIFFLRPTVRSPAVTVAPVSGGALASARFAF